MKPISLSYIITHRNINQEREANLQAVTKYLLQNVSGVEIIVIEQDSKPSGLKLLPGIKHVFVYNPGLFNRSWSFNVGFKNASHDVIAFGDNDVVLVPEAYLESYKMCETVEAVSPYCLINLIDLTQKETWCFIESGVIDTKIMRPPRMGVKFAGGIVFMTRDGFRKVGGWDERIRGWGGEDDYMSLKIRHLVTSASAEQYSAYHLYHSKVTREQFICVKTFEDMMEEASKCGLKKLQEACAKNYLTIGNINKYSGE